MDNNKIFQQKIAEHADVQINPAQQKKLNSPVLNNEGLKREDKEYLELVLGMIKNGQINLSMPSSLLNLGEYEKLSPENKVKVEMRARIILQDLRQLEKLANTIDHATESYQMESVIHQIKLSVDALEDVEGDVLKI